jgi:hypothetical protein
MLKGGDEQGAELSDNTLILQQDRKKILMINGIRAAPVLGPIYFSAKIH